MSRSLDNIEQKIIALLQKDGRMSFVEIARQLSVAEATIRRKYNRLVNDEIIKVVAVSDPHDLGFEFPVMFLIKADVVAIDDVIYYLTKLNEVKFIRVVSGEFNITAEGYFNSNVQLTDFIFNKLKNIEGIQEISTSVILKSVKYDYT